MSRTAIVESATGAILVLDPPTREVPIFEEQENEDGQMVLVQTGTRIEPILPEGIDSEVVTLTAEQEAQIQANVDAAAAALTQTQTAAGQLKQQILDLAQSSVGVTLSALTTAQRSALTACLLWKAGGVTHDMKVKPLADWLT